MASEPGAGGSATTTIAGEIIGTQAAGAPAGWPRRGRLAAPSARGLIADTKAMATSARNVAAVDGQMSWPAVIAAHAAVPKLAGGMAHGHRSARAPPSVTERPGKRGSRERRVDHDRLRPSYTGCDTARSAVASRLTSPRPPGRSGQSWPDVTSPARCRRALADQSARWSKSFSATCFLESSVWAGSLRPLLPCGDGVAWIPLGQETLGESGTMFCSVVLGRAGWARCSSAGRRPGARSRSS